MLRKLRLLISLSSPGLLLLASALSLGGAALSPRFLDPSFSPNRLAGWLAGRVDAEALSVLQALGAAAVVALLGFGIALIAELAESGIDRVDRPERPVRSRRVLPSDLLRWALGAQILAFVLILLAGSRLGLLLALVGTAAGNAWSLPPLRLRRHGMAATPILGGAVALALTAGLLSQGRVTEVGLLSALALGLVGAAGSMIREFTDVDRDRRLGVRSLPLLLGERAAVLWSMAAVAAAYLVALLLLIHTVGIHQKVMAAFVGLAILHLAVLDRLLYRSGPGYPTRASRWVMLIFLGVTAVYVGAQALH